MIYHKILTGSREFFEETKVDMDYIIIRDQEPIFQYVRLENECNFCYKRLTKLQYFDWHKTQNNWFLNFGPLITKDFLHIMNIDIFNEDYTEVYNIMQKAFKHIANTLSPVAKKYHKHLYRLYIYMCMIHNGICKLTTEQLEVAKAIKNYKYTKSVIKSLYEFFDYNSKFAIADRILQFDKVRLMELKQWLADTDYYINKIVLGEWTRDNPKYVEYLKTREKVLAEINQLEVENNG